ncbi:MAG: Nif3-like dinuclear metal center hexameric protein [Lawsonibacter sp.]|jgi:dinuclear metal center YbgI/SA1388 family protein|nr:Nif3-like dinuclear metal center hexameric protein [Lawsonibacter sp.]
MATCGDMMELLDCFLPFDCIAAKDNTGLIVGDPSWPVKRILTAVDLTEAVIDEAIREHCEMIVTHHHIMGKGVKKINPSSFEGRAVIRLIQNRICFCACHNSMDFLNEGTADALMLAVGCRNSRPMYKGYAHLATTNDETQANEISVAERQNIVPGLVAGFGRVGELEEPCTLKEVITRLEGVVTGPVNIVGAEDRMIQTVACQVGWGKTVDMARTKAIGADLLITGDVCHDDRLYAANLDICLLDFCHQEAELPGVLMMTRNLKRFIQRQRYEVEVRVSHAQAPVRHDVMRTEVDYARFGI